MNNDILTLEDEQRYEYWLNLFHGNDLESYLTWIKIMGEA